MYAVFFFFNDTATTEIYTLSLHDALPILLEQELASGRVRGDVAFQLHDTFGFPIEITTEMAEERGVELDRAGRSEEHTSELQSRQYLVCRLLLEKKQSRHYLVSRLLLNNN